MRDVRDHGPWVLGSNAGRIRFQRLSRIFNNNCLRYLISYLLYLLTCLLSLLTLTYLSLYTACVSDCMNAAVVSRRPQHDCTDLVTPAVSLSPSCYTSVDTFTAELGMIDRRYTVRVVCRLVRMAGRYVVLRGTGTRHRRPSIFSDNTSDRNSSTTAANCCNRSTHRRQLLAINC